MLIIDREGTEATRIPGKKRRAERSILAQGINWEAGGEQSLLDEYPDCRAKPQPRKMILVG